jgi:biopolymer transport protein ExbB/TolQ
VTFSFFYSMLKDTMHAISMGLHLPTIIVLLLFMAVIVAELGGLLVEILTERRKAKVKVAQLLDAFQGKNAAEITALVEGSALYKRQKKALEQLIEHSRLPDASLQALARRLLTEEELYFTGKTNRTDLVTRLGPMFGLMATLIPLGPGLIALGQGDTKTLADSLLTAFDATVAGLVTAGIAFAISRLRKRWYEDSLSTLEALMESLLEVFTSGRGTKEPKIAVVGGRN